MGNTSTKNSALFALISVFFFWGFLAASNGIFIPFCKTHFNLSQFQSQLIDSAFYGAYFVGSLLLYVFSLQFNKDIINKIGYKKTIIYGLLISIVGALVMIPAVNSGSFMFILAAFFIIALGFSLQQTSANPLVLNLGNPATGSYRLNFAGSVNSLGTAIGPILVSLALFGKVIASDSDKTTASLGSINILYVILAFAFAAAIVILIFVKIPKLEIEDDQSEVKVLKQPLFFIMIILSLLIAIFAYSAYDSRDISSGQNFEAEYSKLLFLVAIACALIVLLIVLFFLYRKIKRENRFESESYPQVTLGMLAIFIYVGVEVTIQSNMGTLLKTPAFGGLQDSQISPYISLYWGSLMIGRWTGAIDAFNLKKSTNMVLTLVIPFIAFAFVLFMNRLNGSDITDFYFYAICVAMLLAGFIIGKHRPTFTLMLFGVLGTLSMVLGLLTEGTLGIYAFLSGGLFCSIMWPCIFSLAIAGLGKYTSQASGFLIMMILGGAFIPPVQGLLADYTTIHISYIIPVFCFVFLAWYAWKMKKLLDKKGINYDKASDVAH
ncbi:MAG TPA: MFS transporter [Bacteroidia bacterium]|jgi:FHS family L-fucose permease-like MFS transporter